MDNEYLRVDNDENKKDSEISKSSFSNVKQKIDKKENFSFFDLFSQNITQNKETFKLINSKTSKPNILIPSIMVLSSIFISLFLLLITYLTKNFNFVLVTYIFTLIALPFTFIIFSKSFETRDIIKTIDVAFFVLMGFVITFLTYLLNSYLVSKISNISYIYEFLTNALNIILLAIGLFVTFLIKKNISHFSALLISTCFVCGFIFCKIGFDLFYSLTQSVKAFGLIDDTSKGVSAIITTNQYNEGSIDNFCTNFFVNAIYESIIMLLSFNLLGFYFNYALTDLDSYFKAFQISPTIMSVFIIFIYLLSSVSSFTVVVNIILKVGSFVLLAFLNLYILDYNCKNEKYIS